MMRTAAVMSLLAAALAQKPGSQVQESGPTMALSTCTASGCSVSMKTITLDSNWRWVHDTGYTNCYKDSSWNTQLCPDGTTCARNCHLEGVSTDGYTSSYGVSAIDGGVQLNFVTTTQYGSNFGSRIYLLEDSHSYKMFKLKNKEFSLTVDVSLLPCGLNGAVYFVEMDKDGGVANSGGLNQAGAKYGTGYCDAQCPHDMKFIKGEGNVEEWDSSADPPVGKLGSCCAELDIWEANSRATAFTPHPCNIVGNLKCTGTACGDNTKGQRYDGVCDKDGCDFNSYRMGDRDFFGRNYPGANFSVDSKKPVTVVTQFVTADGTDTGDLIDIRRYYVQDGKVIPNSASSIAGVTGTSVTDQFCSQQKSAFGDINDFQRKGGLKAMGDAMGRGMVLVMSLWDDSLAQMLWLDSSYPTDKDPSSPGVARGPCSTSSGQTKQVRAKYPDSYVKYTDLKVGPIGTTQNAPTAGGGGGDGGDDGFGPGGRRLRAVHV